MKYQSITLQDRINLIIREELNDPKGLSFEDFIPYFIENVTRRLTELIQDELQFRRNLRS